MSSTPTYTPITELPVQSDPAILKGKALQVYDPSSGDALAFDATKLATVAKDLSMFTIEGHSRGSRTTANSYIIRTAGTYKIPLVYGCGVVNGNANPAAYTRQGSDYTADFVNHLGNVPTSPYIEKNANCQPRSAALLWQTAIGMISSVSLVEEDDCHYIHLTVDSIPATNGLAIVVVKDASGRIMWGWNLWMTSDDVTAEEFTNNSGVTYKLMKENFGAIWNAARTIYYNPHFQWGRHYMMAPVNGSGSQCTLYDIEGNVYTGFGAFGTDADESADKTVANAIQNPNKFFTRHNSNNHNWNNLAWFNNFWNAAMTASSSLADDQDTVIKTIYDPCPPDYVMPSGRAFTGFTSTGSNSEDSTQFNVVGAFANGWKFKKNTNDTVGNFFPASGSRANGTGGLTGMGGHGRYWVCAPNSQASARFLYFSSGGVYPLYYNYRSSGFSVRPCRELN